VPTAVYSDFLAAAPNIRIPDPPQFSPKICRKNAAAVIAAEFLKFVRKKFGLPLAMPRDTDQACPRLVKNVKNDIIYDVKCASWSV